MKKYLLVIVVFSFSFYNSSFAQAPSWLWAERAGGPYNEIPYSVATDAASNVYIAGFFESATITFGSTVLSNSGFYDIFLAKYDSSGNVLWARKAGGTDLDTPHSIAVDDSGNVYMVGEFWSYFLVFDSITLTNVSNYDMFIAKYDSSGNVLWAKSAGSGGDDVPYSVATDHSGNVYVVGYFDHQIIFGPDTLTTSPMALDGDIFIAKYDAYGNAIWGRGGGGGIAQDEADAVATDNVGNIYVTGIFWSEQITFGSTTLVNYDQSLSSQDIFIAKYSPDGDALWAKKAGYIGTDEVFSVATDLSGHFYLAGSFFGSTCMFGALTLSGCYSSNENMFLTKYDSTGTALWVRNGRDSLSIIPYSVVTDFNGNPIVAGKFSATYVIFGSDTIYNTLLGADVFVAKYAPNGTPLWAKGTGGTLGPGGGADLAYGVTTDLSGSIYLAILSRCDTIPFGPDTIFFNAGGWDMILAKLDTSIIITGEQTKDSNEIINSLYPNPSGETVSLNFVNEGNYDIQVFNSFGDEVFQTAVNSTHVKIDLKELPCGIYFVYVKSGKYVATGKLIKL